MMEVPLALTSERFHSQKKKGDTFSPFLRPRRGGKKRGDRNVFVMWCHTKKGKGAGLVRMAKKEKGKKEGAPYL